MKESREDWNKRVIERLSTGTEKLSALKTVAQKLRAKVERSGGKKERRRCLEHSAMQTKLKQAEEGITSLVDADDKVRKKMGWLEKRQVWEQVLKVMDLIEKFELELQEVQCYFVKLDEESQSSRNQVLFRDYIKGWRVGQGRKRGHICGCIRPKTQE